MTSVLIIDDSALMRQMLTAAFATAHDFNVDTALDPLFALDKMKRRWPDVIVLDHVLADGERGTDFLPRLKTAAAHVPVIIISGTLDIEGQLSALQGPLAAHYVLKKPVRLAELEATVEKALSECGVGEAVRVLREVTDTPDPNDLVGKVKSKAYLAEHGRTSPLFDLPRRHLLFHGLHRVELVLGRCVAWRPITE